MREGTSWINGCVSTYSYHSAPVPIILKVVDRKLPNLEMLRVVVDTFHADINIQVYKNTYTRGQYRDNQPIRSALHTLAEGQHWWNTDAMRFLLQRGANLDIRNPKGETPLHIAVKGGGISAICQMVLLLVQYGADPALGEHPVLYTAILSQDVETVRVIIEAGFDCQKPFKEHLPELLDEDDSDDDLGRGRFSRGSKPRSMRRQKEEGDRNDLLSRPLHFACSSRFNNAAERYKAVAIVELLLAQACSPFLSCQEGTTIIHNVIHQGGILEPLLDLPDLNLEYRNEQGRTLLLAACQEENRTAWFVKRFDNLEKYPLPSVRRPQVIRQLCRMFSFPEVTNMTTQKMRLWCRTLLANARIYGYEPFHLAAKGRIIGMLQPLLGAGANSREVEPDGNPVLHHLAIAIQKDRVGHTASIIDSFLRLGVDINAKNKAGESPLFSYVGAGSYETSLPVSSYGRKADGAVIKSFLEGGANLFTQNNEGENLLHVAAKLQCSHVGFPSIFAGDERYVDPFKYLMELGLDPFQEDNKQRTTVDVAAAYGNEAILALSQKK
ncbi:ankyrin repeat domain-containing protein [Aspergillus alliaceus]|uniref:ankyrin repeat domain-containing protein n=1 Tax=Petromyces alliaceus TaxID=209559 RepID=UPI0012A4A610|nr:ankyrin repeat-containing domain protein [Aspergillus alliaceus]KAB8229518.1 ankyrin repeat-containing domain protein [Aspergillus alliaceus]